MISVSHKQITAGLSPAVVLTGVVSLPAGARERRKREVSEQTLVLPGASELAAGAGKGKLVNKPWYCQEPQSCLSAQVKGS